MNLSFVRDDTAGLPIALALLSGVAAIAMAILLFYPEVSESLWRRATAALRGLVNALSRSGQAIARRVARPTLPRARLHVRLRRRWPAVVLAAMLAIPAALILLWNGQPHTASFGRSATYDTDPAGAVSALLRGEHLTPPAALPPAIFATREVELIRPRLVHASRAWELLDDAFAQRLLRVYQLMKERHGYDMVLIEGYRSPERQNELAALGSHVTGAAAFQSYHQYGLAADSAFLKEGRLVISEKDPWAMQGYRLFGVLAAELGLTWGGNWTLRDFGHVEWRQRRRGP